MIVANGSTDVTTYFVLRDSTNHAPKTDVTITDIDLYYLEQGAAMAAKVDATALAAADSAHADNKAYHCGQGLYRVDWPDAAFDGGVGKKVYLIVVCSGVDTTFLEVELSPSVHTNSIANNAITAASINADAITNAKIADNAIAVENIADNAITAAKIADDAITAAKFDESTAFPLRSADTGATAVARTGADSDTLETLSDEIALNKAILDKLDTAVELDGLVYRFTENALEQAPAGGGGGDATAENQTTIINHLVGMKGATWSADTDTLELIRNKLTDIETDVADVPTNAEFELRTLPAADYTVVSDLGTVQTGDSYAIVNGDHGLVSIQDDIDTILTRLVGTILAGNHNPQGGDAFARLGAPVGASISADITTVDAVVDLLKKILANRLVVTEANGNAVLYDDDNTTPLLSNSITSADGSTTRTRMT